MPEYDVAVCIVSHNSRDDLAECLTKLAEVTPTHLAIQTLVVDNTGADGSTEYVRETWPTVQLITNAAPRGFAANVNQAIAASDARYFLLMNPDVLLLEGAIESLVAYMDAQPDVGVCGPKTLYPDGSLQFTCRRFPHWGSVLWRGLKLHKLFQPQFYRQFLMSDWDHNDSRAVDWLMGSCFLIRPAAFAALAGFDEDFFMYYEDIDFCRRVWQAGFQVVYVAQAVVVHAYRRQSATGIFNALTLEHIKSIFRYRSKHGFAVGRVAAQQALMNIVFFLMAGDALLTVVALQIGRYARLWFPVLGAYPYPNPSPLNPVVYGLVPIIWVLVFSLLGMYRGDQVRYMRQQKLKLLFAVLLSGMVLAGSIYALFLYDVYIPRLLLFYFLLADMLLLWGERFLFHWFMSRNGIFYRPRALLVGSGDAGKNLMRWINGDLQSRLDLISTLPWPDPLASDEVYAARIVDTVRQLQIDEVILTPPLPSREAVESVVQALRGEPVEINVLPDYLDLALYRPQVENLYGLWLISLRSSAIKGGRRIAKRLFDLCLALPCFIGALPLLMIIAIAIKLDSPGPVIFRQQRVGENGRLFWVNKFRSMCVDADEKFAKMLTRDEQGELVYKTPEDPRVTRVGRILRRWSLDELPQLWNVIKGEMSLVGPRPELPFFVSRYADWQYKRLAVPPGITGWWQVSKRGENPMHLSTEQDLYYIEHYSIWMDLTILFKTIYVVFAGKGSY